MYYTPHTNISDYPPKPSGMKCPHCGERVYLLKIGKRCPACGKVIKTKR
jgi:uncharacterized protein (DUF983 family)